jgi:hypothetical protein
MRAVYTGLLSVLLVFGLVPTSKADVAQGALDALAAPWGFQLVPTPGQTMDYYPPDPASGARQKVGDGHVTLMKLYDDSARIPPFPPPVGPYHFDSFFDVFSEISLPGGTPETLSGQGHVQFTEVLGATNTFDTVLSLDLRESPSLPVRGGVMVRESPSKASLGRTSVSLDTSGQYRISSFFDIFTEMSLDNGITWTPAGVPDANGNIVPVSLHLEGSGSPVPEPSTFVLLCVSSAIGLLAYAWRRHRS